MKVINIVFKYFFSWLFRILPTKHLRIILLRMLGASVGNEVNLGSSIFLHMETIESHFSNLVLGNNVYIGPRTFIDLSGGVIVEDSAVISMNSCILTHQDPGELKNRLMAKYYPKKISNTVIRENAYIGANAIILPGVTIGEMAVVGAGSVVTKNVFPRSVVVGYPAKFLKTFESIDDSSARGY